MSRTVLITGDREWAGLEASAAIQTVLTGLMPPGYDTIRHGAARGVDLIADRHARALGLKVDPYPADWDRYGAAAGPIRNRAMIAARDIDFCWAFHDNLANSTGTKDMVECCTRAGIPVFVVGRILPPPTLFGDPT